jgi:hypothetical protein
VTASKKKRLVVFYAHRGTRLLSLESIALLKSHAERNFGMISIETWALFMSTFDLDIGNKWRDMRGSCCRLDVQDRCIHSPCVCGPG